MGEADFRPSTAPRPLDRFSWNLKYITTSRTEPRMQNFRGLCRRGWSGQISRLTHESCCPFWSLRHSHRPHLWTHSDVLYVIIRRSGKGSAFLGVIKMTLEIWTPLPPPKCKNWDFKLAVNGKFSRSNSGTVSHIQFKLGTWIGHLSVITWHDSTVKRSKVKVTKKAHNVYGLTQYLVVLLLHTRGLTLGRPPTSGAQNRCHGNTGCLAMGPRNLHFMIEYIKNAKAYKL